MKALYLFSFLYCKGERRSVACEVHYNNFLKQRRLSTISQFGNLGPNIFNKFLGLKNQTRAKSLRGFRYTRKPTRARRFLLGQSWRLALRVVNPSLDILSGKRLQNFLQRSKMEIVSVQDQGALNMTEFMRFDILSEDSAISDHHYISSNKLEEDEAVFSNPMSDVSRIIAKEWRILESGLPESIYVRVYEQRIDLLRAVIIGSPGTPYHDGLFFFDFVFPPDYPNQPPMVHYHADGYRLNPNLYASGFVCLSLINTWSGAGVENWTPSTSTVLQILVSLQGLVLNDKPYFNEPAFHDGLQQLQDSRRSSVWIKKYMDYNQDVFVFSCKSMMHKLRRPPKGFESFVFQHFCQRQDFILAAIKAYRDGTAVVGRYRRDGSSSTSSVQITSAFKKRLSKTHSDLRKAFLEHGVYLSKGDDQMENSQLQLNEEPTKGLKSKIIKILKKICGSSSRDSAI